MKTTFFFIGLLFASQVVWAQWYINVPNGWMNGDSVYTDTCLGSNLLQEKMLRWEAYQTLDDQWNGPLDSSACLSIGAQIPGEFGAHIFMDEINPNRPVFLKNDIKAYGSVPLLEDWIYRVRLSLSLSDTSLKFVQNDSLCPDNLCTGIAVGIEVPTNDSLGTEVIWHRGWIQEYIWEHHMDIVFCFPTEGFSQQYLDQLHMRFQFANHIPGAYLNVHYIEIYAVEWLNHITELYAYPDGNGEYEVPFDFWPKHHLLTYHDSTFPGPNDISFVDVKLNNPSSQQENINLTIPFEHFFTAQRYTELRGDTVLGGNGLRHNINLINQGEMCLEGFIEVRFGPGDQYMHDGGILRFQGNGACMQFREGSRLKVNAGEKLHYGQNARGVMLLQSGADIQLEQQAEWIMHNRLVLESTEAERDIHLELLPGRTLRFVKGAKVQVGSQSANPDAKLLVHLKGGILDIAALDPASQDHIVIVCYGPVDQQFQLGPNPASEWINLSFDVEEDQIQTFRLFDISGRLLKEINIEAHKGRNQHRIPLSDLAPGPYIMERQSIEGVYSQKFLKY